MIMKWAAELFLPARINLLPHAAPGQNINSIIIVIHALSDDDRTGSWVSRIFPGRTRI